MGKISKYSNLYDKDGNFLHKPGKYTIEENVTADEVVDRYENFKKWHNALNGKGNEETGKDESSTERCVSGPIKIVGGYRRRSRLNKTNTTISTAA